MTSLLFGAATPELCQEFAQTIQCKTPGIFAASSDQVAKARAFYECGPFFAEAVASTSNWWVSENAYPIVVSEVPYSVRCAEQHVMLEKIHFFFAPDKLGSPQAHADMERLTAMVLHAEENFERERAQAIAEGGEYKHKRWPSYVKAVGRNPRLPFHKDRAAEWDDAAAEVQLRMQKAKLLHEPAYAFAVEAVANYNARQKKDGLPPMRIVEATRDKTYGVGMPPEEAQERLRTKGAAAVDEIILNGPNKLGLAHEAVVAEVMALCKTQMALGTTLKSSGWTSD